MIHCVKIDKQNFSNNAGLTVNPEQVKYVSDNLEEYVRHWQNDLLFDCYLIKKDDNPVGFFALDFSSERHPYVSTCANFCVLRCFLIDSRFQGQGLALAALNDMTDSLSHSYPNIQEVFLTVNFKNERAINTYLKAGYTKLDTPYLGGTAGPQHILVLKV